MNMKLTWVPMEKADKVSIPFELIPDGNGKFVYKLPSTLTFGHLELDGVDVTGYFKPDDDDTIYVVRPWRVESAVTLPPPEEPEEENEDESE